MANSDHRYWTDAEELAAAPTDHLYPEAPLYGTETPRRQWTVSPVPEHSYSGLSRTPSGRHQLRRKMANKNEVASALYDEILNTLNHEKTNVKDIKRAGVVSAKTLKNLAKAYDTVSGQSHLGKDKKQES